MHRHDNLAAVVGPSLHVPTDANVNPVRGHAELISAQEEGVEMDTHPDLSTVGVSGRQADRRESVVCLFCGVDDSTLYSHAKSRYDDRWFDVVQCRRCHLVYTNPRIADKPREIEERPRNEALFSDTARLRSKRAMADLQLRRLERFCRPGRLLDFGCGEGVLVHQAVQRGWDAYGTDLNSNLVAVANEHWRETRLWAEPLDTVLRLHRASFDAVISTQVFEHLSNPLGTLRMLAALLKPGRLALIDVPNLKSADEQLHRGASLDPTAHLYYFTRTTLTRLMREAGLSVIVCRAAPNNYGLYRRAFRRIADRFPVALAAATERLPLPNIGKGVFAVAQMPSASQ
jgi:2-polyprenyl-3-methyl-5-hydroxy-6-metoxy-1,4-benzoquinol methylase